MQTRIDIINGQVVEVKLIPAHPAPKQPNVMGKYGSRKIQTKQAQKRVKRMTKLMGKY